MVFGVEWPGNADQDLCEIRIDPPIAKLIGIGQSRLRDLAPDTHVVELATDRTKARFNVTQALAVGQLSKHHRQELIPARKRFYMVVALIARDALLEIRVGYVINELRENGSANVHSYIVPSRKKSLRRQEKSLFWLRFLCLSFKSFLLTIAATIFHTISCSRRSNFTRTAVRRGVRGIIAEAIFAEKIVAPLATMGWGVVHFVGDQPYDFLISNAGVNLRIQVKLQRLEKGIPKIASKRRYPGDEEFFIVEVQKTRTGKDAATQEDTRPYRFGELDILAVSMHPSTKDWNKFLFTVGDWLLPRLENEALIEIMQPVPKEPNDVWTDKLDIAVGWVAAKEKKRILTVDPALFQRRAKKPTE